LRVLASVVAFGVVLAGRAASAEDASPSFETCSPELEQELRAALVVELTDAEPDVLAALPGTALHVTCGPESLALRADDRASGRFVGQTIPIIAGTPRRAAITLLELVRALVVEERTETAVPERALPTAPSLFVMSGAMTLGGEPLMLLGGLTLSVRVAIDPAVQLALAVDGALGALDVAPGHLDVRLLGAALSARFGGRVGPLSMHAGPAVSGGLVSWSGTPASPDVRASDVLGPRLALGAVAAASLILEELVAIDLELGLDANLLGSEAQADGIAVARMVGAAFAVRLGVGWVLP
jgi:hypothetical protein